MTDAPMVRLNNGVEIPQLGFGVFQVPPDETKTAVATALKAGYRHIDTAQLYGNEEGVGQAVVESGLDRSEVFITSKLGNANQHRDDALRSFDETMSKLGIEQLDLFLIHWPLPKRNTYVEAWQTLEELYRDGRIRAIGVSNFSPRHLGRLLAETDVVPTVNQIELHPYLTQTELRAYDREHQIATEAWSPIGGQGGSVLSDPTIAVLAEKYGTSPAQLVIRWHLQLGNIVIPKSANPERIAQNFAVFDFELAPDDLTAVSALHKPDNTGRKGPDPDVFDPH